jgi:hypothetical protein
MLCASDGVEGLIVNNRAVNEIQVFHYLLSSLTGEAHKLIENLPITADNFKVTWGTILKRYNSPRL